MDYVKKKKKKKKKKNNNNMKLSQINYLICLSLS